jgi:DNA phosphorothioation-dependent restriction protein DptG
MLLKASIEPYLHNNLDQVSKYFGNKEAQRKVLFQDWWNTIVLEDKDNSSEKLTNDFNKWFQDKTKDQEPTEPNEGGGE